MSCRIVIRTEAEADMAGAFDWYEECRPGLGREFLEEVGTSLRAVAENPLHYQVQYQTVRRILMRRFPYKIFFCVDGGTIEVIGVVHAKRHYRVWQRRV